VVMKHQAWGRKSISRILYCDSNIRHGVDSRNLKGGSGGEGVGYRHIPPRVNNKKKRVNATRCRPVP